jgi:hypothetical protein
MEKEEIEKEINKLKNFKRKIEYNYPDKQNARKVKSEIILFNHLFTSEYNYAQSFYRKNSYAEIDITDGIEYLERYINSKLKKKDDEYFTRGIKRINLGIEHIIDDLERKINL